MTIEWNKVTWYSKLLALILFISLPFIGFCLGMKYEKLIQETKPPVVSPETSSSTLVMDTSGWKTYRNDKYGFEFMYPDNLFPKYVENGIALFREKPILATEYPHLSLVTTPNPGHLTPKDFYDGDPGEDLYGSTQDKDVIPMDVGGRTAISFNPYITFAGGKEIVIPIDSAFVEIFDSGGSFEYDGTLTKILSTFKFTEPLSDFNIPCCYGAVVGKVTIGPICPVERLDMPCPVPPETYTSRKVIVYKTDGKTVVEEKNLNSDGTFEIYLREGEYKINVLPQGIGNVEPKNITIHPEVQTEISFDIDTGIR